MNTKTLPLKLKGIYTQWKLLQEVQELCSNKEWLACSALTNDLIKKSSNDFFGHYYKGICLTELRLYEDALESFKIALKNVYKNVFPKIMLEFEQETLLRIAHVYRLQRKYDIALERLSDLIVKHPSYMFAYRSKAGIYIDLNNDSQALETVNLGLKQAPKDEELLNTRKQLIYYLTSQNP